MTVDELLSRLKQISYNGHGDASIIIDVPGDESGAGYGDPAQRPSSDYELRRIEHDNAIVRLFV